MAGTVKNMEDTARNMKAMGKSMEGIAALQDTKLQVQPEPINISRR